MEVQSPVADATVPPDLSRGHGQDAGGGSGYVLLPAIPITGLLSVVDPVDPQKKASP